jgi:hypothetical protein
VKLPPEAERLAQEIARLPKWQIKLFLPLMEAATAAHKSGVSKYEFIGFALSIWYGCDPLDLPPNNGDDVRVPSGSD